MEICPEKRQFIMAAHTPPGSKPSFHLFGDVSVFQEGSGHCFTCDRVHDAPSSVDLLFAGPSCKNLSKMFQNRAAYADCYTTGDGESGHTYRCGVLEAILSTCPAVMFFENVLGVREQPLVKGVRCQSAMEARLCRWCPFARGCICMHLEYCDPPAHSIQRIHINTCIYIYRYILYI